MAQLTRRLVPNLGSIVRNLSLTSSETNAASLMKAKDEVNECYRIPESNPTHHTIDQIAGFYTVPSSDEHLFHPSGLPKTFVQQCTTFNETCFMIRKPAIEILQHMKTSNYDNPPIKYVLHGPPGVGKSIIAGHIIHYAFASKWLLLHVPWVGRWLRSPKQVVNSPTRPGMVDLPENAVKWLLIFKSQNQALIKELDLRLSKDYEWSQREKSSAGDSLLDMIELGLNRSRHASEIIMAIVNEVKEYSRQGKCKTLVAIDGFNAFFHANTLVRSEDKVWMPPHKITLVLPFLEATKSDWHNAAIVVVCDELAVPGHDKSPYPLYQLGVEGFHFLNPFVPIQVPLLTETELRSMLDYYRERKWIQNWRADNELIFLAAGNAYKLMNLCNSI